MALASNLIQKEQDKFVVAQSNGNVAVVVTNPDGSNIFGGSPVGISSLPSINGTVGIMGLSGSNGGSGFNTVLAYAATDSDGDDNGFIVNGHTQIWNQGTSKWGRWPGDTTNGAYVNIRQMPLVSLASINGIVSVSGALPAGTNFLGGVSIYGSVNLTQTGLTSLASGTLVGLNPSSNYIGLVSVASINGTVTNAPGTNFIGLVSTASINGTFSLTPATTGGWSKYSFLSLSSGVQQVKSSAGELGGYYIFNGNSTVAFVQFLDVANSSASLGARVPDLSFGIPAGGAANLENANGINFTNAINIAATTTPNGSTGPTVPLVTNLWFK